MLSTMEGGFGMFGDPEDLQARLGELAESMQGAQKVAFADQAIQLAVTMTVAAIRQVELTGRAVWRNLHTTSRRLRSAT